MMLNEKQDDPQIRRGSEDQSSGNQDGGLGPGWGPWADHPSCSPPLQRGSNYGSLLTTEGQFQVFAKTAYYKVCLGKDHWSLGPGRVPGAGMGCWEQPEFSSSQ